MTPEKKNNKAIPGVDSDLFKEIVDGLSESICVLTPEGTIIYANPAFSLFCGRSAETLHGDTFMACIPLESRNSLQECIDSLSCRDPFQKVEIRLSIPGKGSRWYEWYLHALFDRFDPNSRVRGVISSIKDITAMKNTEEGLIEALEKYSALFESSNDAILVLDATRIVDCNSAALRTFGYGHKVEIIGKGFGDLSPVLQEGGLKTLEAIHAHLKNALSNTKVNFRWSFRKLSGEPFYADVVLSPFQFEGSTLITAIVRDISAQKRAEEALHTAYGKLDETVREKTSALRDTNRQLKNEIKKKAAIETELKHSRGLYRQMADELRVVLDGITDNIMLLDTNLNITWANASASLSIAEGSDERKTMRCYESWLERTEPCGDCPVKRALETGSMQEATQTAPDGTVWEIRGYPLKDDRGKIRGVIEIRRNITEKRAYEEHLHILHKLESLGVLAGGIAHDFNNLLTVMLGNVSVAKMLVSTTDRVYKRLNDIEKASLRAKDLAAKLVTFSQGGAPAKKRVDANTFLRDIFSHGPAKPGIRFTYEPSRELWDIEVDPSQMSQVFENILANAVQAMPEGGTIRVVSENFTLDEFQRIPLDKGDYLAISLTDTGEGIEKRNLSKIFDPFFTTRDQGVGLGLAIAYSIVQRHGGYIHVSSKPGKGTTVTMYLPAIREKASALKATGEDSPPSRASILFMDDEKFIRDLTEGLLTHLGFEVTVAVDGQEAIRKYRTFRKAGRPFDAVILDLVVPGGMGALECLKELKNMDPSVRVILSSGHTADPIMRDYRKYGFDDTIMKPYRLDELKTVLRKTMKPLKSPE